jgi:23S rRNA pseudouridine2604 synthase
MCGTLGYEVVALQRIRIMHIHLGHLKTGRWRNLTDEEAKALYTRGPGAAPSQPKPQAKPQAKPKPKAVPFGQPRTPAAKKPRPAHHGRRR